MGVVSVSFACENSVSKLAHIEFLLNCIRLFEKFKSLLAPVTNRDSRSWVFNIRSRYKLVYWLCLLILVRDFRGHDFFQNGFTLTWSESFWNYKVVVKNGPGILGSTPECLIQIFIDSGFLEFYNPIRPKDRAWMQVQINFTGFKIA